MKLLNYLLKHSIVTGPLEKNSSYSHSAGLKGSLLGLPKWSGDEKFFMFGRALHEIYYQDLWDAYKKITKEEQKRVMAMLTSLHNHLVAKKLRNGALCEDKVYGNLFGVEMSYLLDAHLVGQRIGSDLKTTAATTWIDCKNRAIELGYATQAYVYITLAKLKEFYFVFVNKQSPHQVFIISSKEFKKEMEIAAKELEMILWWYKSYGNLIVE